MTDIRDIEVVVFDVLGTLVDEPGGLRAAIGEAVPAADAAMLDELLALWQRHIEREQRRIAQGERDYTNTEVVDAEAAARVAEHAGAADPAAAVAPEAVARLATAAERLEPWGDSAAGLDRLTARLPVFGLSNAGGAALRRLGAHAGLRWDRALSGEDVRAYKPDPAVYRLAIETAGCEPERVLMVAAHAWDLRAAQAVGMSTAYVRRPVGDPPSGADAFDLHYESLAELAAALEPRA